MVRSVQLTGMTWSDPRGYDPMVATATAFTALRRDPAVSISWDKRSLQGFESTPVEELAERYDLMVIDHPHVGAAARQGALLPFDGLLSDDQLAVLEDQSVGQSYRSYRLADRQWALPIDAAAQVQAARPDLGGPVQTWPEVIELAAQGLVVLPMRSPHALMCFLTLAANIGQPASTTPGDDWVEAAAGERALHAIRTVTAHIDDACYQMDPIDALDALAKGTRYRLSPLVYLYARFAQAGSNTHPVAFHDIPTLGTLGPAGSVLGGTGIAISSRTRDPEACATYAAWIAGADCQRGLYVQSGGQPGNAVAWQDAAANEAVANAYRNTRRTLDTAWLRPRHNGYLAIQEVTSDIVAEAAKGAIAPPEAVRRLNDAYRASFEDTAQ